MKVFFSAILILLAWTSAHAQDTIRVRKAPDSIVASYCGMIGQQTVRFNDSCRLEAYDITNPGKKYQVKSFVLILAPMHGDAYFYPIIGDRINIKQASDRLKLASKGDLIVIASVKIWVDGKEKELPGPSLKIP